MRKLFSNEKLRLIIKTTIAHTVTYLICGTIAMTLFNYRENIENGGMKSMEELDMMMIVIGQLVRGVLFGIVIWWIKDSIFGKKLAWLKLWAILVIVGVISVYAPVANSIEGLIYLAPSSEPVPLYYELGNMAEILVQPLLFSLIVTFKKVKK